MTHPPVKKAVIPAAGLGTRFLPATKSVPKEMLPIVDQPVIEFVVEEAVASGIEELIIITARGKEAIEAHFQKNADLEGSLEARGKHANLERVRRIGRGCQIHLVLQDEPLGLGDAVRRARAAVGDEPFAVLLGDTIIAPDAGAPPGLRQLLDVYESSGSSVVAVRPVPAEWVSRYGIVDGPVVGDDPRLRRLLRLVEKPRPEVAPSHLAIAGRYVFTPRIFEELARGERGVGGEIQLTDAMNRLAQTEAVYAFEWRAVRYDIGNRLDYATCFVEHALRREDIGEAFRAYLRERVGG